jgi:2-oxoglutarate dehydrogenase E2 component (dihydrolipoamide succinyltransferase)
MPTDLKVPSLGESITEVEIGDWLKAEGDAIKKDEEIVALESEKATVQLPSPAAGTLGKILKRKGEKAAIGEVIGLIEPPQKSSEKVEPAQKPAEKAETAKKPQPPSEPPPPTNAGAPKQRPTPVAARGTGDAPASKQTDEPAPPAASAPQPASVAKVPSVQPDRPAPAPAPLEPRPSSGGRQEEIVPMTPLRRTVAQRLVEAQRTMAMLTTFNEIDMSAVMSLRKDHQESFTQKHGIKLGFMSFFVKASIEALKAIPQLNASVRGNDIVYHNYFDIGIAIGSGKGLVVPVLRNAERLSFAEIEKAIADFAARAKENKLTPDELQSGTFTITNGGVYGSLLSTPIINPPQSGILGMHTIQQRPIAVEANVVVRPMMYVALSYDHRLVDGREAVTFLVRLKEMIENPARILLEV